MDRFLPWYVTPDTCHPIRGWLTATVGNCITLAAYTAAVVAAAELAWRLA